MKNTLLILLLSFSFLVYGGNERHKNPDAAEILLKLKKLNTLGSVLYLAAHPDDENTRMIAYYANEKCFRTAYLSLTRGDGGQNLIGPEKAEKMGLIRTQELLEARKKDGGQQFFSRANDFGYSKHPDETLEIWDKDEVLGDVVRVIRKFKPDIIITRFTPNSAGRTHGHHTSSAMLAVEAFNLSGDKNAYPEQLEEFEPWSAKRIFFNTSWWFYGTRDFDKTGLLMVDVGSYNKILGKNYGEIAGASRSMHKSQGFGAAESKGSIEEYLDQLDGEKAEKDPFEGIITNWERVNGGEKVAVHLSAAMKNFKADEPSIIVRDLINARNEIAKIKDEFWRDIKLQQVDELILACIGFSVEALADDYAYALGDSIKLTLELINRSQAEVEVKSVELKNTDQKIELNQSLEYNKLSENEVKLTVPAEFEITNPYWLKEDHGLGMYKVASKELISRPESPADLSLDVNLRIGDAEFVIDAPLEYRWVDRVRGELYRDVFIAPEVTVNFLEKALLFTNGESKKCKISVQAFTDMEGVKVEFDLPEKWEISPSLIELNSMKKGEIVYRDVEITPKGKIKSGEIKPVIINGSKKHSYAYENISYDHIKPLDYFPKSKLPLQNIDLERKGDLIGYISGAGDEVPDGLAQMGYNVEYLDENGIIQSDLNKYDAIIFGIRAFNTEKWLGSVMPKVLEYVNKGGNVIVQYNTTWGLDVEKMGPYDFKLGRKRVTREDAEINILESNHPILSYPNKIGSEDFDNWVQERGLYFASEWSEEFEAPFQANDPGEDPSKGMLITCKYGEGYFTYTGISFFRQLPAGVPGAYRLLANLIARGN